MEGSSCGPVKIERKMPFPVFQNGHERSGHAHEPKLNIITGKLILDFGPIAPSSGSGTGVVVRESKVIENKTLALTPALSPRGEGERGHTF